MNSEIQKAFVDGMYEIYTTMFSDGVNDGIKLYLLDSSTDGGIYRESKVKRYKKPVLLVARVLNNVSDNNDDTVESETKNKPRFTVPVKTLINNEIECSNEKDFNVLLKGYIEFHNCFYEIKKVTPTTYVQDTFLLIQFECEYRKDLNSLLVVEDIEESGDLNVNETTNDRRLE